MSFDLRCVSCGTVSSKADVVANGNRCPACQNGRLKVVEVKAPPKPSWRDVVMPERNE